MPDAYSYLRFSSPRQGDGDSVRRQLDRRDQWLQTNASLGLHLVEDFRDLGVSAWRSKNKDVGALKLFLDLVNAGNVKRGSYLLIENLDRLSRDTVDVALHLLTSLLTAGVTVVVFGDEPTLIRPGDRNVMVSLMFALVAFARAGDESRTKSERGRARWAAKRVKAGSPAGAISNVRLYTEATGDLITRMSPAWISAADGGYTLNDHAVTVRRIHEWSAAGLGDGAILRRLIAEGHPPMTVGRRRDGGKWSVAYIRVILRSRAVLGEFEPAVRDEAGRRVKTGVILTGHYPAAVSLDLWQRSQAQRLIRSSTTVAVREHTESRNLFAGLCRCVECAGGHMTIKTQKRHQRLYVYLRCQNKYISRTCTKGGLWRYDEFEPAILDAVQHLLAGAQPQQDMRGESLDEEVAKLRQDLERANEKTKRMAAAFGEDDDPAIMSALNEQRTHNRDLRERLQAAEQAQTLASGSLRKEDVAAVVRNLRAQMSTGIAAERADARSRLRAALRTIISLIAFNADGSAIVELANGRQFVHVIPGRVSWRMWMDIKTGEVEAIMASEDETGNYTEDEMITYAQKAQASVWRLRGITALKPSAIAAQDRAYATAMAARARFHNIIGP